MNRRQGSSLPQWALPGAFLAARMVLLIGLPLEGLRGYGDLLHFFRLAELGVPFFDLWVEFPPLFPFLSRSIYQVAGGQQHVYDYLLVAILTLAQAGSLVLVLRLAGRIHPAEGAMRRSVVYLLVLMALPYGWWYFDPLAVFAMLLGVWLALEGRPVKAGLAIGIGALTKLFPLLVLPALWRVWPGRKAGVLTAAALGITGLVYGALFLASPEMTAASVLSQGSKGSWETVWALVDGNLGTGNFGPEEERFEPATAVQARGRPARIPPWITFAIFGGLGLAALFRFSDREAAGVLAFIGLTWALFLLWSPGWSPQWVLYLLPLVLLVLPEREAWLLVPVLILVNLLEWPLLLSRGFFGLLWVTVSLRTFLLLLLAGLFWRVLQAPAAVWDAQIAGGS